MCEKVCVRMCVCVHLCKFKRDRFSYKHFSLIKCPIIISKCFYYKHIFDTQSGFLGPVALASSGNCQKYRILVSEHNVLHKSLHFNMILRLFLCILHFQQYCSRACCYRCILGSYHCYKSFPFSFIIWHFEQHHTILSCLGFLQTVISMLAIPVFLLNLVSIITVTNSTSLRHLPLSSGVSGFKDPLLLLPDIEVIHPDPID